MASSVESTDASSPDPVSPSPRALFAYPGTWLSTYVCIIVCTYGLPWTVDYARRHIFWRDMSEWVSEYINNLSFKVKVIASRGPKEVSAAVWCMYVHTGRSCVSLC